jgi:hypothetical protein
MDLGIFSPELIQEAQDIFFIDFNTFFKAKKIYLPSMIVANVLELTLSNNEKACEGLKKIPFFELKSLPDTNRTNHLEELDSPDLSTAVTV